MTGLEFLTGGFHRCNQFRAAMLRQPVLQYLHQRLLFLQRQPVGGIQNLCELCHARNVIDRPTLGNGDFAETNCMEKPKRLPPELVEKLRPFLVK